MNFRVLLLLSFLSILTGCAPRKSAYVSVPRDHLAAVRDEHIAQLEFAMATEDRTFFRDHDARQVPIAGHALTVKGPGCILISQYGKDADLWWVPGAVSYIPILNPETLRYYAYLQPEGKSNRVQYPEDGKQNSTLEVQGYCFRLHRIVCDFNQLKGFPYSKCRKKEVVPHDPPAQIMQIMADATKDATARGQMVEIDEMVARFNSTAPAEWMLTNASDPNQPDCSSCALQGGKWFLVHVTDKDRWKVNIYGGNNDAETCSCL